MSTAHDPAQVPATTVDRGTVIGEGFTWLARWSWRLLLVSAGAAILWWILGKLWVGVFPVLLALGFSAGVPSRTALMPPPPAHDPRP